MTQSGVILSLGYTVLTASTLNNGCGSLMTLFLTWIQIFTVVNFLLFTTSNDTYSTVLKEMSHCH